MTRYALPLALLLGLVTCLEVHATPFTRNSPIGGGTALPAGVTEVGGVVFHALGLNGAILTSQLPASSLFQGFFDDGFPVAFRGNPGTIGIQTGFTPAILSALGGGFQEVAVRITLDDGDTGTGDFDENANFLLLNGIDFGAASNFTNVQAQETSSDGLTELDPPDPGFDDDDLETGFFHLTNAGLLVSLFTSLQSTNELVFQLRDDVDEFDNFFDFTAGVDGGLIDVGQGPGVDQPNAVPEPSSIAAWLVMGTVGLAYGWRRRRNQKR